MQYIIFYTSISREILLLFVCLHLVIMSNNMILNHLMNEKTNIDKSVTMLLFLAKARNVVVLLPKLLAQHFAKCRGIHHCYDIETN